MVALGNGVDFDTQRNTSVPSTIRKAIDTRITKLFPVITKSLRAESFKYIGGRRRQSNPYDDWKTPKGSLELSSSADKYKKFSNSLKRGGTLEFFLFLEDLFPN